jgi:hypothetical protein
MENDFIGSLLKNNKNKLNAITSAKLQHTKETAASDTLNRIMPHIKMPSAQEIAAHPWLAGSMSVLQTILAAKLMGNVSKENKRNREAALDLLNKEEIENRSEKERLAALVKKMEENYDKGQEWKHKQSEANVAKTYQDIAESKMKPTLEREKNAAKAKREESKEEAAGAKKAIEDLLAEAALYRGSMAPEEHAKLVRGIKNGTITSVSLKKAGWSPFNILPLGMDKTIGNAGRRYSVPTDDEKKKNVSPKGKVNVAVDEKGNPIGILGN